jgi:hypothetical protein
MWNFLQAAEVIAKFTTGRTGTCTCYMVEESTRDCFHRWHTNLKGKGLHISVRWRYTVMDRDAWRLLVQEANAHIGL